MAINSCVSIIEQLFRKNGGWKRLQGELSVYYWPQIIGAEIASKTEAICFKNGYLMIKTENPALAHQLSLFSTEIIQKYYKKLGNNGIKGIKIKIGTLDQVYVNVKKNDFVEISHLNEGEQRLIEDCSIQISDKKLSDIFSETMKKAFIHNQKILAKGGNRCKSCDAVIDSNFKYCPICERRIKEETEAYLEYLHKKNSKIGLEDLQKLNKAYLDDLNIHLKS